MMSEQKLTLKVPRWGVPLYGQVLGWFFINVALVLVALWLVLRLLFGVSVNDVFAEQLRNRVEPRAELVAAELRESERQEWSVILPSKGKELGVRLSLLTHDGTWWEGAGLPEVLRERAEALMEGGPPLALDSPPREELSEQGSGGGELSGEGLRTEDVSGGAQGVGSGGEVSGGIGSLHERKDDLWSRLSETKLHRPPPRIAHQAARFVFAGKDDSGARWAGVEVFLGGEEFKHPPNGVLVMYLEKNRSNEIFVDWRPLVFIGLGLLLFSGLVWFPFVRRVTRRLRLMTEGAELISGGNFQVNVASNRGDEIGRLSRVIQRMSRRLGLLVDGQKRFLGDTAHELCSPLVRIRMGLGVLEQRLDGADLERLQAVEEEVGELARLVDELLAFSKASLAQGEVGFESVFLYELCDEVGKREALGIDCQVIGGLGLEIRTNPDLLKRALGNLVRNAARYGEGKPLKIKVEKHGEEVWIGVLDRGPGLPEGWTERVFEPFARPEEARTREGGGAGLGLAIVKTCAESLGGRVFCRNRETGGLEVVLVIPVSKI